jgi:hypothetical protein
MAVFDIACCFISTWSLVPHIKGLAQAQEVKEWGAEEDVLAEGGGNNVFLWLRDARCL